MGNVFSSVKVLEVTDNVTIAVNNEHHLQLSVDMEHSWYDLNVAEATALRDWLSAALWENE